jgi:thermitase
VKLLFGTLLVTACAFSAEYVVKVNSSKSIKNLEKYGEVRNLNTQFANFALVKTDMKLDQLKSDDFVYAEENVTYTINKIKDADFEKQWGLENTGRNSGSIFFPGKKGVDIEALEAWNITKGSRDIKIAVIDTGVDYNHEDLKNNIMVNQAEKNGVAGVDDDGNGLVDDIYGYDFANGDADPMDGHGHGTHCAGVIGAEHNNIGIRGVMAKVQILPIKFLKDSGGGTLAGAVQSIDYAIQRGVNIMSNSWGGGPFMQSLNDSIQAAHQAGIVFIAAAGNSNSDNDTKATYPANYDNVISVGALDGKGKRASFSNYGKKTVHVFAPGVKTYSTVQDNKYKNMSGTSMAAPHVSGIVGLLLSLESNLTPSEVKDRLLNSTVNSDDLRDLSQAGYISAFKTIK